MPRKKTVSLRYVVERANKMFLNSKNDAVAERRAVLGFVSDLLMEADVYKGFGYLTEDMVPVGCTFGVIHKEAGKHEFPDSSRVFFYMPKGS